MSTISSFRDTENKQKSGEDCMKTFCKFLREYVIKILNFKKKKMKLLTKDQQESYENPKSFYNWKEKFENKYLKNKHWRTLSLFSGI